MKATNITRIIKTYKGFQNNPDMTIPTGLWNDPEWDASDFLSWFRNCLATKINRKLVGQMLGRKWAPQYQRDLARDAQLVREYQSHIRHTGSMNILLTPEMKKRYPHIDTQLPEEVYN